MANPQKEHGYTAIANEILDAFAKTNLSPYEWRVVFTVIRFSYGWNKKEAILTYSQIESFCGIKKCHIARTIKGLLKKQIITKRGRGYRLQKDYERWGVPLQEVPAEVTKSSSAGNLRVPPEVTKSSSAGNEKVPLLVTQMNKNIRINKGLQPLKDIFKDIFINTSFKDKGHF